MRGGRSTDDAYLQSDLTPISAKVAGYVRSMPVQDYERVRAGQVLAKSSMTTIGPRSIN